ncbi:MAG: hypothetical protein ACRDYC_03795 [Acidimicrobiales bacterium]
MARILDTIPTFHDFAKGAYLESPHVRATRWKALYQNAYPEVFEAFAAASGESDIPSLMARNLRAITERALAGEKVTIKLIEEVQPELIEALKAKGPSERSPGSEPRHVVIVGNSSTNAVVGLLEGEVALFHCMEWFDTADTQRVLVAHETTHAFHQIALGEASPTDLAWMAFYEGLAIRASREVVPGRPEKEYFWYGYPEPRGWLAWCTENREALRDAMREGFTRTDDVADAFFGGGLVGGVVRAGFFIADDLVGAIGATLPELMAMSSDEGRTALLEVLG